MKVSLIFYLQVTCHSTVLNTCGSSWRKGWGNLDNLTWRWEKTNKKHPYCNCNKIGIKWMGNSTINEAEVEPVLILFLLFLLVIPIVFLLFLTTLASTFQTNVKWNCNNSIMTAILVTFLNSNISPLNAILAISLRYPFSH